jgi:hypothetical protein
MNGRKIQDWGSQSSETQGGYSYNHNNESYPRSGFAENSRGEPYTQAYPPNDPAFLRKRSMEAV